MVTTPSIPHARLELTLRPPFRDTGTIDSNGKGRNGCLGRKRFFECRRGLLECRATHRTRHGPDVLLRLDPLAKTRAMKCVVTTRRARLANLQRLVTNRTIHDSYEGGQVKRALT